MNNEVYEALGNVTKEELEANGEAQKKILMDSAKALDPSNILTTSSGHDKQAHDHIIKSTDDEIEEALKNSTNKELESQASTYDTEILETVNTAKRDSSRYGKHARGHIMKPMNKKFHKKKKKMAKKSRQRNHH